MLHMREELAKLVRRVSPKGKERTLIDLELTFLRFVEDDGGVFAVFNNHCCEHTFRVWKTSNFWTCPRFYIQLEGDFGEGHVFLK